MSKYKKEFIILLIQSFFFYIFPLFAGTTDTIGMVILILLTTFVLSLILGFISTNKIRCFYPFIVAVLFVPSIFIYYNESAMIHVWWYFIDSLLRLGLGLITGKMLDKSNINKKEIL